MESLACKEFFELVRAGLFPGKVARILDHGVPVDWSAVYRLAEEQSVVGLVAAGIDTLPPSERPPQQLVLQFVGQTLQLEQRNKAMNEFVARLIEKLRASDIYALLVKGQGIAQCYEKPLWRASGDVDLLLSESNYEKAKELLMPLASDVEQEYTHFKHLGMTIDGWVVELHGTLHSRLSGRVDRMVDEVQGTVFYGGKVRSWQNGRTQVFLPAPDEDVIFVFTHILHHFFFEGIGLRQICDWCRLLWTYRDSLDNGLLESRIRKAGLMTEWKAFYNLASRYLGLPVELQVCPLGESAHARNNSSKLGFPLAQSQTSGSMFLVDSRYDKKANRIMEFVMMSGNFGHNRDSSYFNKYPYLIRKCFSMGRRIRGLSRHARIFPLDSVLFSFGIMKSGLYAALRGE